MKRRFSKVAGFLSALTLVSGVAFSQDQAIESVKTAESASWLNGSSFKFETRYTSEGIIVEEGRALDNALVLRPKFYTPIFRNLATLQLRTNIALDQGPNIKQPIPEARLYRTFSFINDVTETTPGIGVIAPLNGDATTGIAYLESILKEDLKYDALTISPYFYNYTQGSVTGGSQNSADALKAESTGRAAVGGKPDYLIGKAEAKVSNYKSDHYGFLFANEIGATIAPVATKGFTMELALDITAEREVKPVVDTATNQVIEGLVEDNLNWTTAPTLRLMYDFNDNISLSSEIFHTFTDTNAATEQVGQFSNLSVLTMTLY